MGKQSRSNLLCVKVRQHESACVGDGDSRQNIIGKHCKIPAYHILSQAGISYWFIYLNNTVKTKGKYMAELAVCKNKFDSRILWFLEAAIIYQL